MKIEMNIGDRQMAFFATSAVIVLVLLGLAGAYNDPPTGGDPAVMGHSSDEIMVDIEGSTFSLQDAIDMELLSGSGMGFGNWVDVTSVASGGSTAGTDGFVLAYGGGPGNVVSIRGYSPSGTLRVQAGSSSLGVARSVTMTVKSGDTWKVTGASMVYWIPIISTGEGSSGFIPASYNGEESVTFPNGLIFKHNYVAYSSNPQTITFGTAFPNTLISVQVTIKGNTNMDARPSIGTPTTSSFRVWNPGESQGDGYYWQAWGY